MDTRALLLNEAQIKFILDVMEMYRKHHVIECTNSNCAIARAIEEIKSILH